MFGAFHHPHPGLLLIFKCPAEEWEPQLRQIPPHRLQNCPWAQAGHFVCFIAQQCYCQNRELLEELLPSESREDKWI